MPDRIGKARSQMTRYRRLGRGGECCARACNDFRARRNGKGSRRQALRKCVEGPRHLSCRTQPGTEGSNPSPSSAESATNLVAAGGVARGWDPEFESALLQQPVCLSSEP
jgi:hypothetical protein